MQIYNFTLKNFEALYSAIRELKMHDSLKGLLEYLIFSQLVQSIKYFINKKSIVDYQICQ